MKRDSLLQRAAKASGRERYCGKCKFFNGKTCPHLDACNEAFIRGYVKGAKNERL